MPCPQYRAGSDQLKRAADLAQSKDGNFESGDPECPQWISRDRKSQGRVFHQLLRGELTQQSDRAVNFRQDGEMEAKEGKQ